VESNVSTVETLDTRLIAVQSRRRGLTMTRRKTNQSSKGNATTAERQVTKNMGDHCSERSVRRE
jgi:hypothetical protein